MTAVQALVDAVLDQAQAAYPGRELSIALSRENSLLLPLHTRELNRVEQGQVGYYGGPVYRDCLVWDMASMEGWLVVVTVVGDGTAYYGDLRTGSVTPTLPTY